MSDRPPNQIARVIAVAVLITMFLLVIVVIATSGGGGSDSSSPDNGSVATSGPDKSNPKIQEALQKGEYVVRKGDTLTSISDATGIDVDTLITLNPTTDPQALIEGTHLKLR